MSTPHPALGYSFLTPAYEWALWLGVPERKIRSYLIEHIDTHQPLLDFGCGTGNFLQQLQQTHPQQTIQGLDTDPYMVRVSRRKSVPVDYYASGPLPYAAGRFGTVTSTWVFEHFSVEESLFYFREIRRILQPGGTFWLGDWGPCQGLMQRVLGRLVHWIDPTQNGLGPAGRWPELLAQAGFSTVLIPYRIPTRLGTFYYWKCHF